MYRSQLERLQKDKARLEKDLAKERSNIAKLQKDASNLQRSIASTRSASTAQSKQRQLISKQEQIARTQKKIADLEKKIADKASSINQKTKSLLDAEARESKQRQRDEMRHLQAVNDQLEEQARLENARQSTSLVSRAFGEAMNLSEEARIAASHLLEMLEQGEIEKEIRLHDLSTFGGASIQYSQSDGQMTEFPVPIADIKELAAFGVITLQERISRGRVSGWNMLLLPQRLKEAISAVIWPDVLTVFYSWQSWTPGKLNRHFIGDAVEKAAKAIREDDTIEVEAVVDRDTYGEAGSVDIAATIFRKIAESQIFICDATIITEPDVPHPAPNPNVMVELGYAAAVLGWERIICVVNTTFGTVDDMPFDLRSRRLLTYELTDDSTNKPEVKKRLTSALKEAIQVIIEKAEAELVPMVVDEDEDELVIDNTADGTDTDAK